MNVAGNFDVEKAELERALQESAEMERNRKRNLELQFLDDLKRNILIFGGHFPEFGAQPVDEQIVISSDPSQKIIRKKQVDGPGNRLKLMRAALREDGAGDEEDEIERAMRGSIRTAQIEQAARDRQYEDLHRAGMVARGPQVSMGGIQRSGDAFFA